MFFMKIKPLIGRRIRISRWLNLNQPLQLYETSRNLQNRTYNRIITYSPYSKNIAHYHFYLKGIREKDSRGAHAENLALSQK